MLGFESTRPGGHVVKIGLNGPMTNRVKVWTYFQGLIIKANNLSFEAEVSLDQNQTRPGGGWVVWWMGGWLVGQVENIPISAPN